MPVITSQLSLAWQADDGALQRLDFDASVRESYEASGEATEHAVERGASISDHVKPNADTLTLEAIVTNGPIVAPSHQADGATASVGPRTITVGNQRVTVNKVCDGATLSELQKLVRQVPVARSVQDFAIRVLQATHPGPEAEQARRGKDAGKEKDPVRRFVRYGASPRGAQALLLGAKVLALLDGTREPAAVIEGMAAKVRAGLFNVQENGAPISDDARLKAVLAPRIGNVVEQLIRLSFLQPA